MNKKSPLYTLSQGLEAEGFVLERLPASSDFPVDSLLVALDQATEDNLPEQFELVAQLYLSETPTPGESGPVTLQMLLPFPLHCKDFSPDRLMTAFQLVSGCSDLLPFGALQINPEQEIILSYALRLPSLPLPLALVADTLEVLADYADLFLPALRGLESSSHSAEDLLAWVLEELG